MSELNNDFTYKDSVTLKEFFMDKFKTQERETENIRKILENQIEEKANSLEKAVVLASRELERRLDVLNHFKEDNRNITATFITRKEIDLILERIDKDKRSDIAMWLSLAAIGIAVIRIFMK